MVSAPLPLHSWWLTDSVATWQRLTFSLLASGGLREEIQVTVSRRVPAQPAWMAHASLNRESGWERAWAWTILASLVACVRQAGGNGSEYQSLLHRHNITSFHTHLGLSMATVKDKCVHWRFPKSLWSGNTARTFSLSYESVSPTSIYSVIWKKTGPVIISEGFQVIIATYHSVNVFRTVVITLQNLQDRTLLAPISMFLRPVSV